MNSKLRKIVVWSISLAILIGVYLIYNYFSKTPKIVIDTGKRTIEISGDLDRNIGMFGDVGIGDVKVAEFITLGNNKKIDRKWGFAKLLHSTGNQWELEKPYMTIFRDDYKCFITAERGDVLLEQGVKSPSPKDATLTGDVIIHIQPEPGSEISQTTIYFDYLVYLSDRSLFTTAGPVRIVSEEAELTGKGMELIYNEQKGRLEFLRITHLDSFNLKRAASKSEKETAKSEKPKVQSTEGIDTVSLQSQQSVAIEHTPALNTQKQDVLASDQTARKKKPPVLYRCVFRKNVVMELSEQIVFADELFINNIEFGSAPAEEQEDTSHTDITATPKNTTEKVSKKSITKSGSTDTQKSDDNKVGPNTKSRRPENVIITCDGGIFITPMSIPVSEIDWEELAQEDTVTNGRIVREIDDIADKATFVSRKVSYDTISEDVIMEGNSRCATIEDHNGIRQEYRLSAPVIAASTTNDKKEQSSGPVPGIEHLTASGGTVQLDTSKRKDGQLLGFVKLKCTQFDYDKSRQLFFATGPGNISVDNSKIIVPVTKAKTEKFSLQKPCYAIIQNFETLTYSLATKQVIADADSQSIYIGYLPIVQGQDSQPIKMTANRIVGNLIETTDGRTELTTLSATGGVTYDEKARKKSRNIYFSGSDLFYDRGKSLITVWGDEYQPCLLNGAIVDAIKYDLKTGRTAKAKLVGPGILR